jgi:isopentenyl-diphosphate delta-isomerase
LSQETSSPGAAPRVSFPSEELILVDGEDREVGYRRKLQAHQGDGLRHRAFSVFLFDDHDRLLVHRRSRHKPLWPDFWTNSCCSHPRRGEQLEDSVRRRLGEELSCTPAALQRICAFEYHARFGDVGSEHEYCHIFLARPECASSVVGHVLEIAEMAWIPVHDVDRMMRARRSDLTPWFREEWELLRGPHRRTFEAFLSSTGERAQAARSATAASNGKADADEREGRERPPTEEMC